MNGVPDTKAVRGLWDWAFRISPKAARFLFVGFLLLATAALVMAWQVSLGSLAVTAFLVLVAAIVVTLVLRQLSRAESTAIAAFLLWSLVALVVAILTLFLAAAFFGVPAKGSLLVARVFNLPELLSGNSTESGQPILPVNGGWPATSTAPLDVDGDRFERLDALRHRPSVRLTSEDVIRGGGTVYVNTLDLKGDVVVTGGQDLTIEAIKVISEGGRIRSFASFEPGPTGIPAAPGGKVTLIVHDRIVGKLTIDLSGRPGGDGGKGSNGGPGGRGAQGDNAASGLFDCKHGPGRGGDGGPGQGGEDGGAGLDGGAGGVLVLAGPDPDALQRSVAYASHGGPAGRGGSGGKGGDGGPPGPGGSASGLCSGTGPSGAAGPRGADGKPGTDGKPGPNGSVVLRKLNASGTLP